MPAADIPTSKAPAADESINLPLIDISGETPETGKALVAAAIKWGFLWIVASPPPDASDSHNGNGSQSKHFDFDEQTVDNMFALSKKFFIDAPLEEKQGCSIKHNRGWVNMHVENLDPSKHKRGDFKQAFNLAEPHDGQWQQPIPETFTRQEDDLIDFHKRCRSTSDRIFRLLAMGLGISDTNWLASCHTPPSNQSMRLLYYPSLPKDADYDPQADIRAGAHSDYGSITLLFQRPQQQGLEILKPDGSWASVPIFPPKYHSSTFPPILVNIGDLLSYWTNGLLRSTIHRVILTEESKEAQLGEDRFSIAVFIDPRPEIELVPMPSPLVAARAEAFAADGGSIGHGGGSTKFENLKTITAGEHLSNRLKATYGATYQPEAKANFAAE